MKTLHLFLIKKYIPPFLGALFIGTFIFFMIFVFTYIDEIAGKGIDAPVLAEMFFYIFLRFVPESIPLAVLLSSIMVFGNLGENYELAAIKSAGISLQKVMQPILFFIFGVSIFCFFFTNNTLPYIQLKGGRLLHDVRDTKPTFKIKEGIFNNSIEGYSIRVGKKGDDGKTIENVIIYDHTEKKGNVIQIYADKGKIDMTPDKSALIITLENGNRYQQVLDKPEHQRTKPMMRIKFKTQDVRIDLSEFKMQATDESMFKSNNEMMNLNQLVSMVDTMNKKQDEIINHSFLTYKENFLQKSLKSTIKNDSTKIKCVSLETYMSKFDQQTKKTILDMALNLARSNSQFMDSKQSELDEHEKNTIDYKAGWHEKFTLSFACIILFFVGAPLGSIVRKGGLGMPVVISVFLFLLYYILRISFKKMALEGNFNLVFAMWIAPLVFLPAGLWLTILATKDSSLFDMVSYTDPIVKLFRKIFPRKKQAI